MHPLTLLLFFASCLPSVQLEDLKALDEFVNRPDSHYEYTFVDKDEGYLLRDNVIVHIINMTSQKWLDETEVDKPIWSHKLLILRPERIKTGESCLLVLPSRETEKTLSIQDVLATYKLMYLSVTTKSVVGVLYQALVQPLTFYKHPLGWENITGYDIVAYSWWRFINDSSVPPDYLVQFPMVKATVRAMDTITDYVRKTFRQNIQNFTLAGDTTNGWATWLTAAVDKRVAGIIPIAMDFLNLAENFRHQFRPYCGWSYGLKPFCDMNITQKLDDPRFAVLASLVDPLAYNEQYTNISKSIFTVTGDEVFLPDNSRYYFDQLEGVKILNIIPNADYRFKTDTGTVVDPMNGFHYRIAYGYEFPRVSWQITMTNTTVIITFSSRPDPKDVFCYQADTVGSTRRDFRMKIASGNSTKDNPVKWTKSTTDKLEEVGNYKKEVKIPAKGWRGFFIQAIYQRLPHVDHLRVTSDLHIIPDTFPCPDCNEVEDGCHGTLV